MYEHYQKLLDEKGLKNADVSRATGVSNMTLSDWKRGVSTPKQDKLMKIADFLGVSIDYLMTGEEPKVDLSAQADLWKAIRHDKELLNALEKYMKLSDKKKKHVIDTINVLSEV